MEFWNNEWRKNATPRTDIVTPCIQHNALPEKGRSPIRLEINQMQDKDKHILYVRDNNGFISITRNRQKVATHPIPKDIIIGILQDNDNPYTEYLYFSAYSEEDLRNRLILAENVFQSIAKHNNEEAYAAEDIEWDLFLMNGYYELSTSGLNDQMIHKPNRHNDALKWYHFHPVLSNKSHLPSDSDQRKAYRIKKLNPDFKCYIFTKKEIYRFDECIDTSRPFQPCAWTEIEKTDKLKKIEWETIKGK